MTSVIDWYSITLSALQTLWQGFLNYVPLVVGAIVVLVIGWFISIAIGKLVTEILRRIKFNQLFERGNWKQALEKADLKVDASEFVGAIFKWVLVIVFLMAAVEILGMVQFTEFLRDVVGYLPNIVIAVLIFVVTVIIADIIEKVVRASVEGARLGYAVMAGTIAKWAIWIFAIFAILVQLGIARGLILTLFQGLVALIVISAGIAFGLGGKDVAAEILRDLREKLKAE